MIESSDERPVALDLCVGLGGWAEGLIMEGWRVIGVDIEDMFAALGKTKPEHFELVLADICNVRGADYAHVRLIVGSSPCQDFSYRAMPWSRAKALHAPFLGIYLFWQQFRIQREASEAAGRHIPMVVENVRGAQPWVGQAQFNYGSYYIWGDTPVLMPPLSRGRQKSHHGEQWNVNRSNFTGTLGWDLAERDGSGLKNPGFRFDGSGKSFQTESVNRHIAPEEGFKSKGMDWSNKNLRGQDFTAVAGAQARAAEGIKGSEGYERHHPNAFGWKNPNTTSKGKARKAASAKIAKIPLNLSRHIGWYYRQGL